MDGYGECTRVLPTIDATWAPVQWHQRPSHFYGKMGDLKTTIDIPDDVFRRAKATAAADGKSLKEFFTTAIQAQLRQRSDAGLLEPPWEKAFGGLRDLCRENRRIERLIKAEFGTIDEDEWR